LFMLLAFVYIPSISGVLSQCPLTLAQWLPVLATPLIFLAIEELRKAIVRRRTRSSILANPQLGDSTEEGETP